MDQKNGLAVPHPFKSQFYPVAGAYEFRQNLLPC